MESGSAQGSMQGEGRSGGIAADAANALALVELLDQSCFVALPDYSRFEYVSPAAERLWAISSHDLIENPSLWQDRIHPDDRDRLLQFMAEHAGDPRYSVEFRLLLPGGQVRWLRGVVAKSRNSSGNEVVMGYHEDLTAHRELQARLEAERDLRQRYLDTAAAIVVSLDSEGRITLLNPKGCEMLGYAHDELIGQSWFATCLPQPEGINSIWPVFQKIMSGEMAGVDYVENEIVTRAGERRLVAWRNASLRDAAGRIVGVLSVGEDITERRQLERAMQESAAQYRSLVETAQELVWKCDTEGRFTYLNPAWEQTHGYRIEEMLGRSFGDFQSPEVFERDMREFARHLSGGRVLGYETSHIARDGRVLTLLFNAVPLFGPDGELAGTQGTATDLTDWKQAEERLRAGEQRLRDLIDSFDGIVWEEDAFDRGFTFLSHKAERLLHYSLAELSRPGFWLAQIHEADRAGVVAALGRIRASGEPSSFEYRFHAGDGRVVWLRDMVSVASEIGRPRWLRGIMVDISALKESQGRLQLAQQIFETAGEAIFVSDLEGRLLEVNPEACRLAKYSRDEMLRLRNVDIVVAEEVERIAPELRQADRGAVVENRWLLRCSDNTTVPLDLVVQRLPGDRYLAIGRDLTDREKALREVAKARDAAQTANLAKSRFLAAASHDLRQPIQAIHLFCEVLGRSALPPASLQVVDSLVRAVHSLGGLLNALLDISKLDSGMLVPHPQDLLVLDVFKRIECDFAVQAAGRGLRFKLQFPLEDVRLSVDPNLLHTLLGNLIGNAIRYTDEGGLLVAVRRRGARILLQVWDTGIGIAPEHLDKIFDEYFQVDNPQRDRIKGLGLGLAIVRRIARLLDTEVQCRSRLGRGSVFEFSLPIAAGPGSVPVVEHRSAQPSSAWLSGRKVLVVEDDAMVADSIRMALTVLGAEVSSFPSAEAALGASAGSQPEAVISDLRLPGIDGIEFLNSLSERGTSPVRGLLLTGETAPERIEQIRASGWPILFKPVDLDSLLAALETLGSDHASN